jgi:hypothetical protein
MQATVKYGLLIEEQRDSFTSNLQIVGINPLKEWTRPQGQVLMDLAHRKLLTQNRHALMDTPRWTGLIKHF